MQVKRKRKTEVVTNYRHVLLATDLSAAGEAAALRAADLARRFRARLTLLYVIEHFPEDFPGTPVPPEDVDPEKYFMQEARVKLAALASKIKRNSATQHVVISSRSARDEIVRAVQNWKIDLIVIGSHDPDLLQSLLGSTASSVLNHARCDVFAVHPRR